MENVENTVLTQEAQPDVSQADGLAATEVLTILRKEYEPFPTEPRYDPISELVFTILSQHTSDRNSERAFKQLTETFASFEEVAAADTEYIAQCVSTAGLAKIKAPRIKQVLNLILERRGSLDLSFLKEMPLEEAKAWLRDLPGIGPKSTGIILSFALGMPAMAVDTHIYRVSKRLGLIGPKTGYEQAHEILERAVEPEEVYPFHVALITHGRKVCKAPRPLCKQCVLAYKCPSRGLGDK
jgi:endonuclease-3